MLSKKVVLLTGATRGLGLAILKEFLKNSDFFVVATARSSSLDRFKELGFEDGDSLWIRPLDVLVKTERDSLISEIQEKLGGVDVLINNAGYLLRAVAEHVGEIERFKQMDTNFRAPMALVRLVLPNMRAKRRGWIINISSVGGMMAMPTMSVYSASKFALEGASEALWYEVRPWNINVSLVQPGFVNSNSFENVKQTPESLRSQGDKNDPYYWHYNSMVPFIAKMMKLSFTKPGSVARIVVNVAKKKNPPLRVPASLDAHLFYYLRLFIPKRLYHRLLYYLLPKVVRWGESPKRVN